jgi:small integral membrane protein DUF2273
VKGRYIGLIIGAVVGILWMWLGFGQMLVVAVCAFVGYLVVGLLEGEVDLDKLRDAFRRK